MSIGQELTTDRDYHLLRASLPAGGRALTLYEEVHSQKNIGSPKVHKTFLRTLQKHLPDTCCPIIITDAGFRNPWFKMVIALGWDYVGRIRNRDLLKPVKSSDWVPCKTLYATATYRARYLGEYTTTRKTPLNSHLYLVRQKAKGRHRYNKDGSITTRGQSEKIAQREKEPWLITTSLQGSQNNAQQIIAYYKTRIQIEESFRDIKSHRVGFSISESLTRNQVRLEILLLIGALATYLAWLTGVFIELKQWHWQYQFSSIKTRRVLSTFFIGCQMAKEGKPELEKEELREKYITTTFKGFATT